MMKKLFISIFLFGLSVNAHAGTISISPFISGNDVTIARLETQRTTLSNVINGNIESVNILDGTLASPDFAQSVSPVTRWDESFNNFTVTGMLPPTSANLSATTTAGTSYVDGYRVVIGSTAKTYTASKDTYKYVHSGGYYVYQEVSNGGTQPSDPANTLLLAKVVTSGSAVTSVTDMRTLGITLTSSVNIVPLDFRTGMNVSRDSVSTITVQPGSCEVDSTRLAKTALTTLTISTASDWAGGSSLRATSTYGYVGIDLSGNLKLHTTAPTHADYDVTLTAGKKRYATWSGTVYRILGWFYMNASGSGELNAYEVGNIKESDVHNSNFLNNYSQVSTTATAYADDTPALAHIYTSGGPLVAEYSVGLGNSGAGDWTFITVSVDGAGIQGTDRAQVGQASTGTGLAIGAVSIYQNNYLVQGTHTVQGKFRVNASTGYINQRTVRVEEK